MNFAYNCQFCRRPGIATADEEGLKIIKPEVWVPRLCCDRCGDYKVKRRGLEAALFKVARIVETCRINLDGEKRRGIETKARENLVALTKKFCGVVCDYYRLTNVWEQDMADMIFEKPRKLSIVLSTYVVGISKEAKRPQGQDVT